VVQWSDEDAASLLGELGAHGVGGINPDEAQLLALLRSDGQGPLQFVNLLAYHRRASYPEGHELAQAGLTGAEAYGLYGAIALDHVVRRGGALTLYNDVLGVLIGQADPWDQVAVMEYPGTDAFVDMVRDPAYQAGLVHRDAGLAQTVVLVSRPLLVG
jgi:uncharacterized protein (DUF1330 family)